jgi:preprotein translocase subunit Sec63
MVFMFVIVVQTLVWKLKKIFYVAAILFFNYLQDNIATLKIVYALNVSYSTS